MTRLQVDQQWRNGGDRRVAAVLLHGALQADEVASRTGEDWRNANRRFGRLLEAGLLQAGPGSARKRLLSLPASELDRAQDAAEAAERDSGGRPGQVKHGATVVRATVPLGRSGRFRRAYLRQAASAAPEWVCRVHDGPAPTFLMAFDDSRRDRSQLMMQALAEVGVDCSAEVITTVYSPAQFRVQLAAEQEAAAAEVRADTQ